MDRREAAWRILPDGSVGSAVLHPWLFTGRHSVAGVFTPSPGVNGTGSITGIPQVPPGAHPGPKPRRGDPIRNSGLAK